MKFKQRHYDDNLTDIRAYAIKRGVLFGELSKRVFGYGSKLSRMVECDNDTYEVLMNAIDDIAKEKRLTQSNNQI